MYDKRLTGVSTQSFKTGSGKYWVRQGDGGGIHSTFEDKITSGKTIHYHFLTKTICVRPNWFVGVDLIV